MIDKKKLMAHIESQHREWGDEYDALQILGDIEDFPKADVPDTNVGKLIPCSERLPEEDVEVLIYTDNGTFDVACMGYSYLDNYDIWKPVGGGYRKQENVIAWMPLPEPFKEGGGSDG